VLGPGAPARADATRNCNWQFRLAGDQVNAAYPDEAAQYWVARVFIPPGSHIEAAGRYPHARYISYITYTGASQAIDGIADVQIAPDPGSTNPFLAGANREAGRRSYHVNVVNTALPTRREPNTVYTDNGASGTDNKSSSSSQGTLLIYRVYEADRGRDIPTGGVGLPTLSIVGADGSRTAIPDCPDTSLPDAGVTPALAAAGPGAGNDLPTTGLGGRNPPYWTRYTNAGNSVATGTTDNNATGDTFYPPLQGATAPLPSGGFYENVNNAYVYSFFTAGYGDVLLLRARAPTTPRTLDAQPVMGTGQLRYYSFCTNATATQYIACRNDDAIPLDASGYFTVAISTAANRPANATERCGVAWLPAGPTPQSILILRNMLPDSAFAQAVQNAKQGTEEKTLGPYYPRGTYYHRSTDVERLGCHPPAIPAETVDPGFFRSGAGGRSGTGGVKGPAVCRPGPRLTFHLHAGRGQRVVAATVYVDGRAVRRLRGRSLRTVAVRRPARRAFSVRVVTRLSNGSHVVSRRVFSGCSKTPPRNRGVRRWGRRRR
ncbi:MAG TPA: hypothetical protein VGN69_07940, partial [Solirubrobacteraceae bacterium]|nr:hypothetical protein [Solirubrobacteraceae bacterium]